MPATSGPGDFRNRFTVLRKYIYIYIYIVRVITFLERSPNVRETVF